MSFIRGFDVSGDVNVLALGDLAANTIVKLGGDLPYDEAIATRSDTTNNRPTLTVGDILGTGVLIDVTGDGTPRGIGGGGFGDVTVRSSIAASGTLADIAILAGQALVVAGTDREINAALDAATLGNVSVSGSIVNTKLVAGSRIGSVTAGGGLIDSLFLAGAMLDGDDIFDGNESYQRAAAIAGVIVKGMLARSSIAAGVDPMNGVFRDAGDVVAPAAGSLATTSEIGPLSFGSGGTPAGATMDHQFGIEAATIQQLKVGGTRVSVFSDRARCGACERGCGRHYHARNRVNARGAKRKVFTRSGWL